MNDQEKAEEGQSRDIMNNSLEAENVLNMLEDLEEENQEMHKRQHQLRKDAKDWYEMASRLQEQNKRYEEALITILDQHENEEIEDHDFMNNVEEIARQALQNK